MGPSSPNYPLSSTSSDIPQQDHATNLTMLYFSFFVVASTGVIIAVYHCVIINWCARSSSRDSANADVAISNSGCGKVMELDLTVFKYQKGRGLDVDGVSECVVCLSAYEEGEKVRRLLRCSHCFHVSCIDMWLYSRFDCPLCRAPVEDVEGLVRTMEDFSLDNRSVPVNLV